MVFLCKAVSRVLFSGESYFLNKNIFVVFLNKVKSLHHHILYHVKV